MHIEISFDLFKQLKIHVWGVSPNKILSHRKQSLITCKQIIISVASNAYTLGIYTLKIIWLHTESYAYRAKLKHYCKANASQQT